MPEESVRCIEGGRNQPESEKEEIEKADALFFMSNRQAKEIARLACGDTADKNDFKRL